MIQPVLALVITFALAAVVSYASEGQQKRVLRRAFNRYFSPHVVADILDNAGEVELGGKTIEATVFFSDIKDFTSIAEKFTPKDLVHFLNAYFSLASDIILKNEAMLDKYIGDAIMAIFGAPIPRPDNAKVACLTALEIQEALAAHHSRPDRDPAHADVRDPHRPSYRQDGRREHRQQQPSGLHCDRRHREPCIAARRRQQGLWHQDHHQRNHVRRRKGVDRRPSARFPAREGESDTGPDLRTRRRTRHCGAPRSKRRSARFEEGLALYHAKDFARAGKIFESILAGDPADGPSTTYVKRCAELEQVTLPEDWDGVYTLTSK